MRPSTDLYELIASLTLSEKRYFRLFAGIHMKEDQKNFLLLFDEIEKQILNEQPYNEEAITKTLHEQYFIRYLPRVKNDLYQTIMQSLLNHHENSVAAFRIKDLLKEIQLLFRKGLFGICYKSLHRAKKLAFDFDQFPILLEVLNWERKLIQVQLGDHHFEHKLIENLREEQEVLTILQNISDLRSVTVKVFIQTNKNPNGSFTNCALQDWVEAYNESSTDGWSSFTEQRLFHVLSSIYHFRNKNFRKAYHHQLLLIDLMKANSQFIKEEPFVFLFMYNNLLNTCAEIRKYDQIEELIDEMRQICENHQIPPSESIDMYLFFITYIHQLNLYNITCRYEQGYKVLPAVITGMERYKGRINIDKELELCSRVIYFTFARNDFKLCMQWVERILQHKQTGIRNDIFSHARIMKMILLFEMGEWNALKNSTESYTEKTGKKYHGLHLEKVFATHFCKWFESPEEKRKILQRLKSTMEGLMSDPQVNIAMNYFDYTSWVRSKLNKTTFAQEKRLVLN